MTPTKSGHSERSSVIRIADGGTQSRNLLLDVTEKQVSRLRARNNIGMSVDIVQTSIEPWQALPFGRTEHRHFLSEPGRSRGNRWRIPGRGPSANLLT